jgi:hypothetical protein
MKMLTGLIDLPVLTEKVSWDARYVLRDLGDKPTPHLFLRIKLTGTYFDHRALGEYVKIGKIRSVAVEISDDCLSARAYFDRPLPSGGRIEFGYEDQAMFRLKSRFEPDDVRRLDPTLLRKKKIMFMERFYPDLG